jgi:hypothetical protein
VAGVIPAVISNSEKQAGGAEGDVWGHSGEGQTFILSIWAGFGPKSWGERGVRGGKSIENGKWEIYYIMNKLIENTLK